jgi:hypothetical protein
VAEIALGGRGAVPDRLDRGGDRRVAEPRDAREEVEFSVTATSK